MKKALSFLLVLCLMFSLSVSAFAATATPAVDKVEVKAGEDVTVTLSLDKPIENLWAIGYNLYVDSDLFEFKSFAAGEANKNMQITNLKTNDKGTYYGISLVDTTSEGQNIEAGTFATIVFTAKETTEAKAGTFELVFEKGLHGDQSAVTGQEVGAAVTVTVNTAAAEPDGSAENPFLISTAADLIALSDKVYGGDTCTGLYYKVTNDIVLDSSTTFRPIGTGTSKYFAGNFDGQGHTISGLNVSYYSNSGFFGYVKNATLANFIVKGTVTGSQPVGGVVGSAVGSTLRNIGSEIDISSSANRIGGVVGYLSYDSGTGAASLVSGCYYSGTITSSSSSTGTGTSGTKVGGIVGFEQSTSASNASTVENCYNRGTLSATQSQASIGGIVGGAATGSRVTVKTSYNAGTVNASKYGNCGDIIGDSLMNVTTSGCPKGIPSNAAVLGDAFKDGPDGYPILAWEAGSGEPGHVCTLEEVAEVPAKCTETGVAKHYKCTECGKLYTDDKGVNETTLEDLATPATGHTYDDTLTCTVCQYVNPVLALIQEKAGDSFTAKSSTTQLWQATGTDGKTLEANGADTAVFTLTALKSGTLTVKTRILGMMQSKLTITSGETVKATLYSTDTSYAQTVTSDAIEVKAGDVLTFTYSNDYTYAKPADYYVQITSMTFTEAPQIVLTVNEKTADAADATEAAAFTKEQLVEKATTEPTIGYQYWRGGTQNLVVTTQYVTLADILGDITFEAGDKLIVKASDGFSVTYTYETLNTAKYYQAEENGTLEEIPAAIAIVWDSGSGTFEELEKSAYDSGSLRFGHGIASGEYGSAAGRRLISKVSEITVVHPCANHTLADKVITAATCTETGVSTKYCTVCGYVSTETFTTDALGHDLAYTENANGTHTASCTRGDYSVTEAHTYGDDGLCVCGAEKADFTGYTVALPVDAAEIGVGEEATVSLKVGHTDETVTAYNAYHFVLTYDADKLTYKGVSLTDAQVTDNNGTLTILGYGDDKATAQAITVTFEGKAAGTGTVALTAANIDALSNAHAQNAPAALIEPSSTEIIVTAVYDVTLPEGFTGEPTVKHGDDYTFEADNKNYDYKFDGSKMGDAAVDVVDNGDGTFTVKNVTGDLTITATKTGKTYNVTVTGSGKDDVTAAATATYGEDYTLTIDKKAGYNYAVTVTINGAAYSVTENNGSYTISGDKITGDIEINVVKTVQPITSTTIVFEGDGKDDVKGGTSQTATIGQDFTFEIDKKTGFDYTVKLGEIVLEPVNGVYTIPGADIGTDTIVVTVEKKAVYSVEVYEYVKADGQSVFLVLVSGTPGDGKVFAYDGNAMFHSAKYDAYAYLVFSNKTLAEVKTEAAAKITETAGTAAEIDYTGDVNKTGKIDVNDAQLVWNMYNAKYASFNAGATLEMFLRADLNGDKQLNVSDAAAVVGNIK